MENGNPTSDGFVPSRNDPMLITRQFRRLHISGGSPGQVGNNSAQITAAGRSHARPRTKPVHTHFEIPPQPPAQPLNWPSESIDGPEDDLGERHFEVDEFDEWSETLAMRSAMHKKGKGRTRTASKRLFKGPIRNKIGGVGRHRRNALRASLPNQSLARSHDEARNRSSGGPRAKKDPVASSTGRSTPGPECLVNPMASLSVDMDLDMDYLYSLSSSTKPERQ